MTQTDVTPPPAGPLPSADTVAQPQASADRQHRVTVIANAKSGTNARDSAAIDRAIEAMADTFGKGRVKLVHWNPKSDDLETLVERAEDAGATMIVAAGGDGTAVALSQAMLGRSSALGVLPLGTFNFFARSLGLPEDPAEAGRVLAGALKAGRTGLFRVGTVNGQLFLNNASLGIYPAIMEERENVYAKWGRRRIMSHLSVLRTFLRFQRPMHLTITADGETREIRTPLLFVSRSAFQLDYFRLAGSDAVADGKFAVLLGLAETRWELFRLTCRLLMRRMQRDRDYLVVPAHDLDVKTRKHHALVAYDGEKSRGRSPFQFRIPDKALRLVLPEDADIATEPDTRTAGDGASARPDTGQEVA